MRVGTVLGEEEEDTAGGLLVLLVLLAEVVVGTGCGSCRLIGYYCTGYVESAGVDLMGSIGRSQTALVVVLEMLGLNYHLGGCMSALAQNIHRYYLLLNASTQSFGPRREKFLVSLCNPRSDL